jgi:hypothetical protein
MSKWPIRGQFRHVHFKTFPMTPRTPQCEVFWPFNSSSKFLGVPEDSKFPLLGVWASPSHLAQSGVATIPSDSSPTTLVASITSDSLSTFSEASSSTTFGPKDIEGTSATNTLLRKFSHRPGWRLWRSVWPLGKPLDLTAAPRTLPSNLALRLILGNNGYIWTFSGWTMSPFGGTPSPLCTF